MSPIVEVLLIAAALMAALVWVFLYFFLIEGSLKRLVGHIFGVTIGGSKLMQRSDVGHTKFYVSGWSVIEPQSSGCLFDMLIWTIGSVLRSIFIAVPVGALVLLALYLTYLLTRP